MLELLCPGSPGETEAEPEQERVTTPALIAGPQEEAGATRPL